MYLYTRKKNTFTGKGNSDFLQCLVKLSIFSIVNIVVVKRCLSSKREKATCLRTINFHNNTMCIVTTFL